MVLMCIEEARCGCVRSSAACRVRLNAPMAVKGTAMRRKVSKEGMCPMPYLAISSKDIETMERRTGAFE